MWPEHFDFAVTVGRRHLRWLPRRRHPLHAVPVRHAARAPDPDGDRQFWNEPFGASLSYDRVADVADAVAFFAAAEAHLAPSPTEVGS